MTTKRTTTNRPAKDVIAAIDADFQLEDPPEPERNPEDMTTFPQFTANGTVASLVTHLGNTDTTVYGAERYIVRDRPANARGTRYPDLYIAFDADPDLYQRQNGYIIADQGKPPDFVMEIASASTRPVDDGAKRIDYADLGIGEYWRFDQRVLSSRPCLSGDRLEDGVYVPLPIQEAGEGRLRGYSEALGVYVCWEEGVLRWFDPVGNRYLTTFQEEREARVAAEARAIQLEQEVRRLRERS